MPDSKHHYAMERQWRMLRMIPRHEPGITVAALLEGLKREGFSVGRRTLERDLNELGIVFDLVSTEEKRPQLWYWASHGNFDIPGISLAEAITLGLLRHVLRSLMPKSFTGSLEDRFALADRKLSSYSGSRYSKWTELIAYTPPGLTFIPPSIDSKALDTIQDALLEKRKVSFIYRSPYQDEKKTYTVNPLGIHLQGHRPYFLATVGEHTNVLHFAIQRMGKTEMLSESSIGLPGFSLQEHIEQGHGQSAVGEEIRLRATLTEYLATLLEETPLSTDQKITRSPQQITLTATLHRSWQLDFWLLSQGSAITVTSPVSLRKHICKRLKDALANYEA
jgi:predicted DNA-binding transcriptional regulator YafY